LCHADADPNEAMKQLQRVQRTLAATGPAVFEVRQAFK
jgi:hypothetical protein